MKRVLLTAILALTAFLSAMGQCMPLRPFSKDSLAFTAGEKLTYRINYKWGPVRTDVAKASLTLNEESLNGETVYAARIYAKTANFYDNFFKLREDFRSWFTTDRLVPQRFYRDTREGKYRCTNDYSFFWDAEEPYISADIETSRKPLYNMSIPLDDCTFDAVTLFYTARNMDMDKVEVGKRYPMTFAVADDVYTINFKYLGNENKSVKGFGTVDTMKFDVEVVEGDVFTGDSDMTLWFSNDENRILVFFEAPLKIGIVRGRIDAAEGLAHEFTSLSK